MTKLRTFNSIKPEIPFKALLLRLGYNKKQSLFSSREEKEIRTIAEDAAQALELRAVTLRTPLEIEETAAGKAGIIVEGCAWESDSLGRTLSDCSEVLLMAATGGMRFQEELTELMAQGEMRKAVIWNALGSEMVDSVLDWLKVFFDRELLREGRKTANLRFSPGYGDLGFEVQEDLFKLLDLKALGINLNQAHLMTPEKSVTAISGTRTIKERGEVKT